MLVKMTARQVREIKPYMYFVVTPDWIDINLEYDFVFSGVTAYKIHRESGYTECLSGIELLDLYKEKEQLKGVPDDTEVLVEPFVLQAWLRKGL